VSKTRPAKARAVKKQPATAGKAVADKSQPVLDNKTHDEVTTGLMVGLPEHVSSSIVKRLLENTIAVPHPDGSQVEYSAREIQFVMEVQRKQIASGRYQGLEAILLSQINLLNAIFQENVVGAISAETYTSKRTTMDIAMKAQNQCRRTIQGLVDIRQPGATFIKQQNNAVNQQINNTELASGKNIKSQNELKESDDEQILDAGKTQTPIDTDTQLEALGEVNRTNIGAGKSKGGSEQL